MSKPVFYPPSLSQQEYWSDNLAYPERPFSNVAHCIEIAGECDIECLYQAHFNNDTFAIMRNIAYELGLALLQVSRQQRGLG